jgi:hypothetical protein
MQKLCQSDNMKPVRHLRRVSVLHYTKVSNFPTLLCLMRNPWPRNDRRQAARPRAR